MNQFNSDNKNEANYLILASLLFYPINFSNLLSA